MWCDAEPTAHCNDTECLNGGVCVQQWNAVTCDCDMTSFTGPQCDHGLPFTVIVFIILLHARSQGRQGIGPDGLNLLAQFRKVPRILVLA